MKLQQNQLTILHTSDWHLGRTLYGRKRYNEFERLLAWLYETIQREQVDVLLVAGDIFDTSAPSNRAQQLYYRFLCRVAASSCRHVVITAGNHDSPSFLNAPKDLLKALNVHVVGAASESLEDEVLVLSSADGSPELIVCAVPYLRDREIRAAEAGESIADKHRKIIAGIRDHYAGVVRLAEQKRAALGDKLPIVAMGHLFTAGGKTVDGDGVRELYVGAMAHVDAGIFPDSVNYAALGHLHVPQIVNGSEIIRYSGSPLPVGFGEAKQAKSVCLVKFAETETDVVLVSVPVFQKLERIRGSWEAVSARIRELSAAGSRVWLEIVYEGEEVIGDLRVRLDELAAGSQLEILRVKNTRIIERVLGRRHRDETLDDLTVNDIFGRCLAAHMVPAAQHPELVQAYREIIAALQEADTQAE